MTCVGFKHLYIVLFPWQMARASQCPDPRALFRSRQSDDFGGRSAAASTKQQQTASKERERGESGGGPFPRHQKGEKKRPLLDVAAAAEEGRKEEEGKQHIRTHTQAKRAHTHVCIHTQTRAGAGGGYFEKRRLRPRGCRGRFKSCSSMQGQRRREGGRERSTQS